MTSITEDAFRKIGFTGDAICFPLSPFGIAIRAKVCGVPAERLPETHHYAPNHLMQDWYDTLGFHAALGLPIQHADGRYMTRKELTP